MEWEKKFYDILRETDSNLASAKLKLKGMCRKDANGSLGELGSSVQWSSSSVQPVLSPLSWDSGSPSGPQLSQPVASQLPAVSRAVCLQDEHTSGMGQLLSKIDSQNLMIDRLERLVRTLSQEKDQYRRHISDLQYSVGDISSRLNEAKYLNPHLESQMDLMRHEVRSDLQRLQNMISSARNSSLQSNCLQLSFKDMQHSVLTELEAIRRDLYSVSHRVGRLELDMSCHSVSQRDLHDRLNASLLTSSYPGHSGHTGHYFGGQTSIQASRLEDLRSIVSDLHGKLDSLEGRLVTSNVVPSQSSQLLSGLQKLSKSTAQSDFRECLGHSDDLDDSCDLDDLDLSDLDLSSDSDENSNDVSEDVEEIIQSSSQGIGGRTPRMTQTHLDLSASDDKPTSSCDGSDLSDLDLDDLDLSSAEGSADLGSVAGGSIDLKLDDV